jgi:hypothetical protein
MLILMFLEQILKLVNRLILQIPQKMLLPLNRILGMAQNLPKKALHTVIPHKEVIQLH